MNKKATFIAFCALLFLGAAVRANACNATSGAPPEAGCWFPMSGKGYHVKYVGYDQRSGKNRIQVHLTEYADRDFYYDINTNDLASLSKANAIYAALLAARASGDYIGIYLNSGSIASATDFWFISVQVGEN